MRTFKTIFAALIICLFCTSCSDQTVIKETAPGVYLVDGKKQTQAEVIQYLKTGNFPDRILFSSSHNKVDLKRSKVIQILDDLSKKKKVQVRWDIPSNDINLKKFDGDMGYKDTLEY